MQPLTITHNSAKASLSVLLSCLALGGACLLSGCQIPLPTHLTPVRDYEQTFEFEHCTVKPPAGTNWVYYAEHYDTTSHLIFLSKSDSLSHQRMADVTEVTAPKAEATTPQQYDRVIDSIFKNFAPGRKYEITSETRALKNRYGVEGLDVEFHLKDFDASGKGTADFLSEIMIGHVVRHPSHPGIFVAIGYQERGNADELSEEKIRQRTESFLQGMQLTIPD